MKSEEFGSKDDKLSLSFFCGIEEREGNESEGAGHKNHRILTLTLMNLLFIAHYKGIL